MSKRTHPCGKVGYQKHWRVDFNALSQEIVDHITHGGAVGLIYGLQCADRVLRDMTKLALKRDDAELLELLYQIGYVDKLNGTPRPTVNIKEKKK